MKMGSIKRCTLLYISNTFLKYEQPLLGKFSPDADRFNELLLVCGISAGKLAWPIMADNAAFPRLLIVHRSLHCSTHPPLATHTQPAGTEMAAPLTRLTIPPLVHATIEGHGHRHLYGTQEAEEGTAGPRRQVVLPMSL